MADDLRAKIAEVLAGHGAELAGGTNAGWYCCGNWSRPYGVGPDRAAAEHRQHVAEAILAAFGEWLREFEDPRDVVARALHALADATQPSTEEKR